MQPLNDITNIITDAIFGEGNHGTSTPWQMSILSDSQDNSTRRPLRDITNITRSNDRYVMSRTSEL
ncbi:hypothetical protein EJB05_49692, partial [Eragrostis curvula]